MKKLSLIVLALGMVAFVSCKKEYTCECTSTYDGVSTDLTPMEIKDTKKNAEDVCEALNTSILGTTVACDLK